MKHSRSERGVALIICLFALMLLSGIGLGMMYMADTETTINRNYRDSQQAYFAAVAGLQEVRQRLMPAGSLITTGQAPTTLPGAGLTSGVTYVRNSTADIAVGTILPWDTTNPFFDTEFCKEKFVNAGGSALVADPGTSLPCALAPTAAPPTYTDSNSPFLGANNNLAYRWVRVTLKANNTSAPYYVTSSGSANNVPICWDTSTGVGHQIPNPGPAGTQCEDVVTAGGSPLRSVYVLTSLAVVPNSGSRRMVQMEVANDAPFITNAALDTDDFVNVKGASVTVNGYDNCKCACDTGKGSHPPVCTNRVSGAPCTGNTYSIYSSKEITTNPDPSPGLVAGTSPPYAENQTFPYDVPALIARYSTQQGAVNITGSPYNQTCTPQTPPAYPDCGKITSDKTLGTLPTPFPPTDPTNPVGLVNQTTYVPGNLDITAKVNGAGVLIIDGDFTVHGGLNFYGLIIVRGVITFAGSGGGQDVNVIGSIVAGEGSVADKLSGGINIQFDRCALMNNTNPAPPSMLATHELSY